VIGRKHSEDIRELRETADGHASRLDAVFPQIEAIHAQLSTLSLQIDALSSQLAAERERWAEALAMQAETLKSQAGELDFLRGQAGRHGEAVKQLHGAVTRIDRQAAIDLDEMRRTSAAMARAVFLRPDQVIAPIADQDGK
jgi:chromosome segregation ATPase